MRFRRQSRQIAKLLVDKVYDGRVMDLDAIMNSLEQWVESAPDEPGEQLLRHLVQSAPSEIEMHVEWTTGLYKFLARKHSVSLGTRYRQWRQRSQQAGLQWALFKKQMNEPGPGASIEYRRWRHDILLSISGMRTRINIASQYKGFGSVHLAQRQNVLLFRNELLFWELRARWIRRRYRDERRE